MTKLGRNGAVAMALIAVAWIAGEAQQQLPVKIPTGDQERLVNLELRVSHLEQALAQMQKQGNPQPSGKQSEPPAETGTERVVVAPFLVMNSEGHAIFQVEDSQGGKVSINDAEGNPVALLDTGKLMLRTNKGYAGAAVDSSGNPFLTVTAGGHAAIGVDPNTGAIGLRLSAKTVPNASNIGIWQQDVSLDLEGGVGNLHLFHGNDTVGLLSVNPGGKGAKLQLNDTSGTAGFTAGISLAGEGFAKAVSKAGAAVSIGTYLDGPFGVRIESQDGGPPSAGMFVGSDKNGTVYAGAPGKIRTLMNTDGGQGYMAVVNDAGVSVVELTNTAIGGSIRAALPGGQTVAEVEAFAEGGHGIFTNNGGKPLIKLGAASQDQGDACIVRGDKPGRCLSQSALPLSIAPQ